MRRWNEINKISQIKKRCNGEKTKHYSGMDMQKE
jgi:hypothetical protein